MPSQFSLLGLDGMGPVVGVEFGRLPPPAHELNSAKPINHDAACGVGEIMPSADRGEGLFTNSHFSQRISELKQAWMGHSDHPAEKQ